MPAPPAAAAAAILLRTAAAAAAACAAAVDEPAPVDTLLVFVVDGEQLIELDAPDEPAPF